MQKAKRAGIIALAAVICAFSIVPFIDAGSSSGKVRLVVDLHGYTPSTNRTPTADSPDVFNSTYYIAEAFMEENPDVEIVWARTKPVGGMDAEVAQWFTTQIAGGTVPAIAFSWGTRYQDRDWYLPLDEYLDSPWEYEGGYATWKDVFRDYLWESNSVINARGETVAIPLTVYPGASTGYFYNKTAFSAAGIEEVPVTWGQFVTATEKLEEKGYVGVAPWLYFDTTTTFDAWVFISVMSPAYAGALMDVIDYDGNGIMSSAEQARACLEGVFSTSHEYTKDMYRNLKYYYTHMLKTGWASIDYNAQWLNGTVGIREEGLWAIPSENSNVVRNFDYGVFVAPLVSTDTSPYVKDVEFSNGPYNPSPDLAVNIMKAAVEGKPRGPGCGAQVFEVPVETGKRFARLHRKFGRFRSGQRNGAFQSHRRIYPAEIPRQTECGMARGIYGRIHRQDEPPFRGMGERQDFRRGVLDGSGRHSSRGSKSLRRQYGAGHCGLEYRLLR